MTRLLIYCELVCLILLAAASLTDARRTPVSVYLSPALVVGFFGAISQFRDQFSGGMLDRAQTSFVDVGTNGSGALWLHGDPASALISSICVSFSRVAWRPRLCDDRDRYALKALD